MSVLDRIDGQGGCMASGERHGHWVRFRLGEVQAIPKLQVHGDVGCRLRLCHPNAS